ncbi:hypothetical protein MSAN_02533600 [Mycena sanguinolenta]|uniref:Ricin B lectin domain-containing protein n=1 Tax=Mycena sanguinolenta TaxID=230812 RepID=A0A8H6TYW1_9AGAR|nr:hypothetical protein MSAN_02533600 [Mycena sanguinolenta]
MQLLCSLIVALLALATTAVGVPKDNRVALTPDAVAPAGLTNIHDFLGNSLVALTSDGPNEVPVVAVSASSDNETSQQWTFAPLRDTGLFEVESAVPGNIGGLFMSSGPSSPNFSAMVVSELDFLDFALITIGSGPGILLIEDRSGQALTSWAVEGLDHTPVTLAPISPDLQNQQSWTILAAPAAATA